MKTMQGRFRAVMLMAAAVSVLAFSAGARAQDKNDKKDKHDNDQWSDDNSAPHDNAWPYQSRRAPVLAVVGDISCQPGEEAAGEQKLSATKTGETCTDSWGDKSAIEPLWTSQEATANQIEHMKPDAVALLGDLQYQVGRYSDFEGSFDLTYGAFKFLHRPAPGNHEFYDEHGEMGVGGLGYFAYYNGFTLNSDGSIPMITITDPCPTPDSSCKVVGSGALPSAQPIPRAHGQAGHFEGTGGLETGVYANGPAAGTPAPVGLGKGWYSYNMGSWHLISLNIECYTQPGGCSPTGAWFADQLAWLKKDLEENHSDCTLAYWHQPMFSGANSISQEGETSAYFWQLLYQYGADVVLNGHDHLYARYKPLAPSFNKVTGVWTGVEDDRKGIREFIVGTGGETLDPVNTTTVTASEATASVPATTLEDPSGNAYFNATYLETPTGGTAAEGGQFWGVMKLTLDDHSYKWDFKAALADTQQAGTLPFNDEGVGYCHGGH